MTLFCRSDIPMGSSWGKNRQSFLSFFFFSFFFFWHENFNSFLIEIFDVWQEEKNILHCTRKSSLPLTIFLVKWPNPQFHADLVTLTEEILNVKLHFFAHCWTLIIFLLLSCFSADNILFKKEALAFCQLFLSFCDLIAGLHIVWYWVLGNIWLSGIKVGLSPSKNFFYFLQW